MPDIIDVLGERYELRESLSSGDSGDVFRAWDRRQRREVLIRTYVAARLPAGALRRYKAAIDAARQAPHPAVRLPLELRLAEARPFVAFEPPTGEDLETLLIRMGAVAWGRALEVLGRCADALATVTAATGVFHGALTPASIRISADGEPQITDLGRAELGVQPLSPRGGKIFVEYRAPEQLDGSRGSARSDVYTLGILLFEMMTGIHPFSGPSAFMATHAAALAPIPSLQTAASGMPFAVVKTVQKFFDRALARDPQERFGDMGEMARALDLVRRAIGSPVAPRGRPARSVEQEPQPASQPTLRAIEDPTTMMRLSLPKALQKRLEAPERRAKVAAFSRQASNPAPAPVSLANAVATVPDEPMEDEKQVERLSPQRAQTAHREEPPVDRTEVMERRPLPAAVKAAPVPFEEPHTLVMTRTISPGRPKMSADVGGIEEHTELFSVSAVPTAQAGQATSDRTLILPHEETEPENQALEPTRAMMAPTVPLSEERTALHATEEARPSTSRRTLTIVYIVSATLAIVGLLGMLLRG